MKTILFTVPSLSMQYSKMPRILEICRCIDRSKYSPMVSVDHKGRLDSHAIGMLNEIQVPVKILRMSPHPSAILKTSIALLKTAREQQKIDISIQHSFDYSRSWTEPIIARLGGVPYWITEKANMDFTGINWIIKFLLASKIIVQSLRVKDIMVKKYPALESKIVVIPNGVNTNIFKPQKLHNKLKDTLGIPPDSLVLGYIAHLLPIKNHKDLIDALANSQNRSRIHLLLVGRFSEDDYKVQLDKKINDLGLTTQVHFLGLRSDIPELCSIMDGIVLSSVSDSLSNGILQGMACGLPAISSNVGGMADVVRPGINGWLVEMGEDFVNMLSIALDEWASDDVKRHGFGVNSLEIIRKEYTVGKMIQKYLQLYESLSY
jgi:glycosyltransferase involved in cell wall biosynthesis